MSHRNESSSPVKTVVTDRTLPVLLGMLLVFTYAIAQGAAVLRDLVVPAGGPVSMTAESSIQGIGPAMNSFGNLAGNLLAGAPVFVLLAIGIPALVVYRGQSLVYGILLSMTLILGVFVGIMSIFVIARSGVLPFLIGSALVLGVLYGGAGSLLGAGARYITQ